MKYQLNHYSCSSRVLPAVGIPVLFAILAFLTIVLGGCDFGEEPAKQCTFDGKSYAAGETVPGVDSCNTCVCTDEGIACTGLACPVQCEYNGAFYQVGDVFDAGDGCNTCSCTEDGVGICTQMACPEQCPAAKISAPDETCVAVTVHAKSPNSGLCCFYATPCEAPEGWDTFGGLEECQGESCVQISCPAGMGSEDTNGDGCDDVCVNACTDEACGPQPLLPNYNCPDGETIAGPTGECTLDENQICGWVIIECPAQCEPGDQKEADDGCNTCECTDGGIWACTEMSCPDSCPPPMDYDGVCITVEAVAKHPVTGECCYYPTPCVVPDGLEIVTYEECQSDECDTDDDCPIGLCIEGKCMTVIPCETVACAPGYQAQDTDGDGCDDTCAAVCGTIQGLPCPTGSFCQYPTGSCNSADLGGICVEQPDVCTDEFNPQCGCDGQTYGNPCELLAAGAQLAHAGECDGPCATVDCAPGYIGYDSNGDGCDDTCVNGCTDADCGPQLGMPNYECSDGKTWAGPTGECKPSPNGECGWEVIECPIQCEAGEQKEADDGCNTCSCTADGVWICTEMACQCNPDTEWNREYVSTNPAECALIDFACPANTAAFFNECGCGCQQKDSCPQWFNCMPPSDCNPEKMALECPYSDFAY